MAGFTANEESFRVFEIEQKLIIPLFQRKYVWKEENWKELFDSFFKNSESIGFLGSILVQRKTTQRAGVAELEIIDGQQRLTTISILVMAIYDSLDDEKKENAIDVIHSMLFSKGTYERNYKPKLVHSKSDREEFNKVIKIPRESETLSTEEKGIIGCYNYFVNQLKEVDKEKREAVFDNIAAGRDKFWVVITLDGDMDEQSIFDTLNNSGVSLTASDTIKNYLFKKAYEIYKAELGDNEETESELIKLYEETWARAFAQTEEICEYWDKEKVTGRVKRQNLDLFLFSFGIIKGVFTTYDNNISELSKCYKTYIDNIMSKNGIDELLNEILSYSIVYREHFDIVNHEKMLSYSHNNVLDRLIHLNEYLEITAFNPYILKVLKDYDGNNDDATHVLHLLEKYLVFNNLTKDLSKTKNYNKMCMTIINDAQKLEKECSEINVNTNFVFLDHITNKMARFYLFWIELFRRSNNHDEPRLFDVYSLEHIMPQKWKENWRPTENRIDYMQFESNREDHINKIGNMTLLNVKLNTSISNKAFSEKIEKMRSNASLKITKEDIIDVYDNGDKIWDETKIDARTKKIKEELIKTFLY